MKKVLALICLLLSVAGTATATTYTFSGTSATKDPVVGSATEDITITGNTLTMVINNTSPYPTTPAGLGAPAITGFGVDLTPNRSDLLSATLNAYSDRSNTSMVDLLALVVRGKNVWTIENKDSGITLDYLPSDNLGVRYGLYNPAALAGQAADPLYTRATLTLTFKEALNPDAVTAEYVRFQNVGNNGSLKLYGEQPHAPVPEPGTMMLLGAGFLGLAIYGKRRRNA